MTLMQKDISLSRYATSKAIKFQKTHLKWSTRAQKEMAFLAMNFNNKDRYMSKVIHYAK